MHEGTQFFPPNHVDFTHGEQQQQQQPKQNCFYWDPYLLHSHLFSFDRYQFYLRLNRLSRIKPREKIL